MRALAKLGPGPAGVALVDRPDPVLADDGVVVEVAACGVCASDLKLRDATAPLFGGAYPLWLGHEYAGTVVAVGARVDGLAVGDRVTAEPSVGCGTCAACRAGAPNVCPDRRFEGGGFAERVAVPAARVHRLPVGASWAVGALTEPLACAVHAVAEVAPPIPGTRVAVVGPGPIGLLAALVARALGARPAVIGRARRPERLALARSLGLDTVAADDAEQARAGLAALGAPDGVVRVYGCAGGAEAVAVGCALTQRRGTYVEVALAGAAVAVDLDDVVRRELHVTGAMSQRPSSWRTALDLVARGAVPTTALDALVTASFPLDRWADAFEAAAGRREGKVLVRPGVTDRP